MTLYLDTSAFLKLLVDEEHSAELRDALGDAELWSSIVLDVEAHRAARRLGVRPDIVARYLEVVTLVSLVDETVTRARSVGGDALRTLDALHLATAMEMEADVEAVVTYDRRLAAAAVEVSLPVSAPGLGGEWWRSQV